MPRLSRPVLRRLSAVTVLLAAAASGPVATAQAQAPGLLPTPATAPSLVGSMIGPSVQRRLTFEPAPTPDSAAPPVIEYSDWYARRLTIHQWGSYAMLPLFAAEYALGDRLLSRTSTPAGWVRPTHVAVAYGLGALFTANTVTGVWNAWDARHDPYGRTRRLLHSALMLAADAGFAYTGSLGESARESLDGQQRHRNAALTSMGIATVGSAMMWLWRD